MLVRDLSGPAGARVTGSLKATAHTVQVSPEFTPQGNVPSGKLLQRCHAGLERVCPGMVSGLVSAPSVQVAKQPYQNLVPDVAPKPLDYIPGTHPERIAQERSSRRMPICGGSVIRPEAILSANRSDLPTIGVDSERVGGSPVTAIGIGPASHDLKLKRKSAAAPAGASAN